MMSSYQYVYYFLAMTMYNTGTGILIFIVDDNIEILKMVQKRLNNENYMNVMAFSAFKEFYNTLHLKPGIVVLDNYLSKEQNSIEESITNFKMVKKKLPETEFIILSGEDDKGTIHEFISSGAYGYIVKDTGSMDKLISSVRQISLRK